MPKYRGRQWRTLGAHGEEVLATTPQLVLHPLAAPAEGVLKREHTTIYRGGPLPQVGFQTRQPCRVPVRGKNKRLAFNSSCSPKAARASKCPGTRRGEPRGQIALPSTCGCRLNLLFLLCSCCVLRGFCAPLPRGQVGQYCRIKC